MMVKTILTIILKSLGNQLGKFLFKLIGTANELLKFLNYTKKEKENKKIHEENEKIKDACDNGQLKDILSL